MDEVYKSDLQNGLGNLVARVAAMVEKEGLSIPTDELEISSDIITALEEYKFDVAMSNINEKVRKTDQYISENQIWKLQEKEGALVRVVKEIRQIAVDLQPFLPKTAEKIIKQYNQEKITKSEPLFPRLV